MTKVTKRITLFSLLLLLTACIPYPYPVHYAGSYYRGGDGGGHHHHHHGDGHYRDGYGENSWRRE